VGPGIWPFCLLAVFACLAFILGVDGQALDSLRRVFVPEGRSAVDRKQCTALVSVLFLLSFALFSFGSETWFGVILYIYIYISVLSHFFFSPLLFNVDL
jgi:hypothetical protein